MTTMPAKPTPAEGGVVPERIFIDCEFDGHDGPLLSIALVCENGRSIHIRVDVEPMDLWVRQNVLPLMERHDASESATVYHNHVGRVIRDFLGEVSTPVIVADSPVDIGRFCRALSTGEDGGWASADYPLMTFEVHNVDCYPTDLEGAVQHNAWWDAMALRHALAARPAAPTQSAAQTGEEERLRAALEQIANPPYGIGFNKLRRIALKALSQPEQSHD